MMLCMRRHWHNAMWWGCVGLREERWLVHNALGGGRARRMAVEEPSRGLMPWVGIAAPLDPPLDPTSLAAAAGSAADSAAGSHAHPPTNGLSLGDATANGAPRAVGASGRAFCFLPLPIFTGLPACLHINGYFELSSNRRDIWCVCTLLRPRKQAGNLLVACNA